MTARRLIPASAILVSLLQAGVFALTPQRNGHDFAALACALTQLVASAAYITTRRDGLLAPVLALYLAQLGLAAGNRWAPRELLRLLEIAIVLAYAAPGAAWLLSAARVPWRYGALLPCTLAVALLVVEAWLGQVRPSPVPAEPPVPMLIGSMRPHAALGGVNAPHSVTAGYYRAGPDGRLREEDFRRVQWELRVAGGNRAHLLLPSADPNVLRVEIARRASGALFDIQLNRSGYDVKAGGTYLVTFRARAASPRNATVGVARAHGSWDGLGLYQTVRLTPEWRTYEERFVASNDDGNARMFFDLGAAGAPVEISGAGLRHLPDGAMLEPAMPASGQPVRYRFNQFGCRGPDYPIPRQDGTTRLLVLGNAHALGEGVAEELTFASRLERLLQARAGTGARERYEAINCGAAGYGARESRLFYRLFGSRYKPDVVILTLSWNDDLSFWEQKRNGHLLRTPARLESLFFTWAAFEQRHYRRPAPDYRRIAEEIRQLDREVREEGVRLAVFLFRNNADYPGSTDSGKAWNQLAAAVEGGLRGLGVPVLDLGTALARCDSGEELAVHSPLGTAPDERAHSVAARALEEHLRSDRLLSRVAAP